jgi:hypothetical protein
MLSIDSKSASQNGEIKWVCRQGISPNAPAGRQQQQFMPHDGKHAHQNGKIKWGCGQGISSGHSCRQQAAAHQVM